MSRAWLQFGCLVFGTLALAPAARSATFDFIYYDRVSVTLCPNACGVIPGQDFGLVVNKGLTDISAGEFFGTTFTVNSSRPEISLTPFINNPGPPVAPIHPNEAVGGVPEGTSPLTALLLPGETLRNTAGLQVIGLAVSRTGFNSYAGPVTFDVTMTMGGNVAHFTIPAEVTLGGTEQFAISFSTASRVSSVPLATPARPATWGAIKQLYR